MDRGGGAVALVFKVVGDLRLPENLAIEVEGGGGDGVAAEEIDVDPLAITGRRDRGPRGLFIDLLGESVFVDGGGPEELAGGPIKAVHRLNLGLLVGGGEVDAVAGDTGRAMAAAGDGDGPQDALILAEGGGWRGVGRGSAIVTRSPPPGPVSGSGGQVGGEEKSGEEGAGDHSEEMEAEAGPMR